MEITNAFLGRHSFTIWVATLFWTLFILVVYKLRKAPKLSNGFSFKYFLNDNAYDILLNLSLSALVLRAGDGLIRFSYQWLNNNILSKFNLKLDADSLDVVIAVALVVSIASYFIHKYWRPAVSEKIKKEMKIHNNTFK